MTGPERAREAKFWRATKELQEEIERQNSKPPTITRCRTCGEYDFDPDMPCACRA